MSDIEIRQPTFRHRITRDWKFWAALSVALLLATNAFNVVDSVLENRSLQQQVSEQSSTLLCRSRAALEVERASAELDVAVADLFVIATASAEPGMRSQAVVDQAAVIGARNKELRAAIDKREESLVGCVDNPVDADHVD